MLKYLTVATFMIATPATATVLTFSGAVAPNTEFQIGPTPNKHDYRVDIRLDRPVEYLTFSAYFRIDFAIFRPDGSLWGANDVWGEFRASEKNTDTLHYAFSGFLPEGTVQDDPRQGWTTNYVFSGFRSTIQIDDRSDLTPVNYRITVFQSVPEPGSWALMIAGFGLAGAATRRSNGAAIAQAA